MKSLKFTSLLCGGALSLAATSVMGQQSSTTQPGSSSSPSSASQSSPSGTSSQDQNRSSSALGSSSSSLSSMQSGNTVRLSQLMNGAVQSQEGKTLGHIRDLTVDPQSGRIEFAILSPSSAGGASDTATSSKETVPSSRSSNLGTSSTTGGSTMTGKLIPVPWQLFSQSMGSAASSSASTAGIGSTSALSSQNLVLNIDESKLRTAPSFDASNWNQIQTGSLDQRVYSFFGVDQSSATGTAGSSISGQGASQSGSSSSYGTGSSSQGSSTTSPSGSSTSPSGSSTRPQDSSSSQGSSSSSPGSSSSSPTR